MKALQQPQGNYHLQENSLQEKYHAKLWKSQEYVLKYSFSILSWRTHPVSNSENWFEMKKNADKSTFFLSIICKKQDILSV